jgi:hypothetical protein
MLDIAIYGGSIIREPDSHGNGIKVPCKPRGLAAYFSGQANRQRCPVRAPRSRTGHLFVSFVRAPATAHHQQHACTDR